MIYVGDFQFFMFSIRDAKDSLVFFSAREKKQATSRRLVIRSFLWSYVNTFRLELILTYQECEYMLFASTTTLMFSMKVLDAMIFFSLTR